VTVTAHDAYGNVATGYAGTVGFTISEGSATLPPDYTFQPAADLGSQTFTVTLNRAGPRTLSVYDTTGAFSDGGAIVVSPGAAAFFALGVPSTVTAGAPFSVTVTARDAHNNVATNYTGTVTLQDDDPAAPPALASHTFVAGDAGVYTFTGLQLFTAGAQLIQPSDGVVGCCGELVQVTPAAAASLALSGPSAASAGSAFPVTVTASDAYGNVATGYGGTVTFSSDDASASLPGDYPFQQGDQGVQTFQVTLVTPGTRRVRVTDTLSPALTGFLDVLVS
jgi:hypothetical protein